MLHHFTPTKTQLFYFLVFVILLRIYTLVLFPGSGVDGPMYLSHAFTILNGRFFENDFLREYIPVFNFPYLYGFLNAPFYLLFKGTYLQTYSLLFWSTIWVLLFMYGAYRLLYKQHAGFQKFGLFAAAYSINIYTNSTRSEIFMLPFFVLLLYLCNKAFKEKQVVSKWLLLPLLVTIIGLMHPVAGVFACAVSFVYALENKTKWLTIIAFFSEVALLVAIMYLPVVFINYDAWRHDFFEIGFIKRTHSFNDFSPLLKYLLYNPGVLILAIIAFLSAENFLKELLIWLLPFFSLCYFHQSYYYQYLFVLLLWRLYKAKQVNSNKWMSLIFYATLLYGFLFGSCWPVVQYLENPAYTKTYSNALTYLYNHKQSDGTKKVWVPGDLAMPIIDRTNTRLHWFFILDYRDRMHKIDTTSTFYFTLQSQLDYIKKYPFAPGTKLQIINIIKPCKGLITISPHFDRSESLGLWKIIVVKE